MKKQAQQFDHSSDPQFLAYYAQASQSEETVARFSQVLDRAQQLLIEHDRAVAALDVVDIGCGAGAQAMIRAERGHHVRALDVNEPLITLGRQRARDRGLQVHFDVGTATQLPYEDGSADVVLLPELLEHVAEWEACLTEAARIPRPGGVLYLSTSNWLCPHQQEFNLPLYSWYPGSVKRWCERKAVTTHPEWANYARYPAVNWFSYFGLSRWLRARRFQTLDRFDMLARQPISGTARKLVGSIRALPPVRLLAHMATEGTTVWALRNR